MSNIQPSTAQEIPMTDAATTVAPAVPWGDSTVFVSGLPPLIGLRKLLKTAALADYQLRSCRVNVNCFNHSRGYAYLTLKNEEAAKKLIQEQNGKLRLPGTPAAYPNIYLSFQQGKMDILFPHLPPQIRSRMVLDSTALFSVTDQVNAQRITQLILCLLKVAQRPPDTKLLNTLKVVKRNLRAPIKESTHVTSETTTTTAVAPTEQQESAGGDEDMKDEDEDESDATDMNYSPDAEINRLVTEIARSSWSTWTDLDDENSTTNSADASPPIHLATSPYTITDGCACAGGNVLDFARHFAMTYAIEMDPKRCVDLQTNIDVLRLTSHAKVIRDDFNHAICGLKQDVVYLDPPWGGSHYKELLLEQKDLYLGSNSLIDICWNLYQTDSCRMILLRAPFDYDHDALASAMVRIPQPWFDEATRLGLKINPFDVPRPHPFKLVLEKVVLLVLCLPSREEKEEARRRIFGSESSTTTVASAPSYIPSTSTSSPPPLHFNLQNLDSLIYTLAAFDHWYLSEFEPAFYDWEKHRWISVRRWKGCAGEPAKKDFTQIDQAKQLALENEGKKKQPGPKPMSEKDKAKALERKAQEKAKRALKFAAKQERKQAALNSSTDAAMTGAEE